MGFGVWGSGFRLVAEGRIWGAAFKVENSTFRVDLQWLSESL
jgi:hypothetical protein